MEKIYILVIAILFLVILGFLHSRSQYPSTTNKTTTTNKTVIIRDNNVKPHPPPLYNPYKAQFY